MITFMGLAVTSFIPDQYMQNTGNADMSQDTGQDYSEGEFHGDVVLTTWAVLMSIFKS